MFYSKTTFSLCELLTHDVFSDSLSAFSQNCALTEKAPCSSTRKQNTSLHQFEIAVVSKIPSRLTYFLDILFLKYKDLYLCNPKLVI